MNWRTIRAKRKLVSVKDLFSNYIFSAIFKRHLKEQRMTNILRFTYEITKRFQHSSTQQGRSGYFWKSIVFSQYTLSIYMTRSLQMFNWRPGSFPSASSSAFNATLLQNTTISIEAAIHPFTSSLQQWERCPEINRHEVAPEVVLYYNRHTKPLRAIAPGQYRFMAWAKKIECGRCSYALNNGTSGAICS